MKLQKIERIQQITLEMRDYLARTLEGARESGYQMPSLPSSAYLAIKHYEQEITTEIDQLVSSYPEAREEADALSRGIQVEVNALIEDWLRRVWLHDNSGKSRLINTIGAVIALHGGKVYMDMLPAMLYLIDHEVLRLYGHQITGLAWHVECPHVGSYEIYSPQLTLMQPALEKVFKVSSPSLRSSYITTDKNFRSYVRVIDSEIGKGFAARIKDAYEKTKGSRVEATLPVQMWSEGYRPYLDRLDLEGSLFWDSGSMFESQAAVRPIELMSIDNKKGEVR